ncbi:porphobilinogen synthase [Bartonella sp. TP]|uniref:porphobilinogen synthase n=1 Tax=Bartonella sp. TP TaxID=3057550 RepID=UPI0025B1F3CA|nr:porphobilinogen synthase [Bartonella sp. TP]MDN5248804.1 porphobilinogen synthase [Alphaproteobacteria bacterium]WJW80198.1 porphobilinogen synthase [Bartonella sp. TP]
MFPSLRLSRLRRSPTLRALVQETHLQKTNFIYPVFVEETAEQNTAIAALPGQSRIAENNLGKHLKNLYTLGIKAVILFGVTQNKDTKGSNSLNKNGFLARIVKIAKDSAPEMLIITDNCFCEYTEHGHCGILTAQGYIDNDASIKLLAEQAVICAEAGCDMVAPSAMLDGQIQAIRVALDKHGFEHIPIMSYAIKFASSFYGPFRHAAKSAITNNNVLDNRKTYQMDMANANEALQEAILDEKEGADILMVKPAGLYLDVITKLRDLTYLPVAAYQVSGEYSAIKFACAAGLLDENAAILESLTAIKRAGASIIISYFTPQITQLLQD